MKLINREFKITNTKDVETFFHFLVDEKNLNFHPDDLFEDYFDTQGNQLFTQNESEKYNHLMEQCFDVCAKAGKDIYLIGMRILQNKLGIKIA